MRVLMEPMSKFLLMFRLSLVGNVLRLKPILMEESIEARLFEWRVVT